VDRNLLVNFLRSSLHNLFPDIDIKEWSGISLRKGGATSAVRTGVHPETIEKLGNWKSNAYKSYIDNSQKAIAQAQLKMATLTNNV